MDGLQCTHNFPNQRVGAASYIRMRENQKARTTTIDCAPKTLSVNNSTPTNSSLYISTLSHWTPYIISCRASKTSCLDICQKPTLSFDLVASTSYYIFYTTPLFFSPYIVALQFIIPFQLEVLNRTEMQKSSMFMEQNPGDYENGDIQKNFDDDGRVKRTGT